ncbi:predicted protein [Naegleria gruberi]|uniref:Predicted protein n=1 Tax=Naegleria gruberi TaxID=5762 RepID=D2VQQ7_NAEGR|nr:uncharacterized protein NAEGRDRAFT_71312 [Naegleria gruberi]EFC40916.1 predicted protein [Naegleria gruberi]|eukprot:XP_002673660.1 predicted protein [Naegleria gruberi strain NEG-M]
MNHHHAESYMNGWMVSRWSSSNNSDSNKSCLFTHSEPSSPREVYMSCFSHNAFAMKPQQGFHSNANVGSASCSASCEDYFYNAKDKLNYDNGCSSSSRKDFHETVSVTSVEGHSTLSTDISDSYSTFLKLDVEDFIQSCISQSQKHSLSTCIKHASQQTKPQQHSKSQFKQIYETNPVLNASTLQLEETIALTNPPSLPLPPKISKNSSSRKTHSSSSSSLDSLVPERRKRNKRSYLPGERKMIMWKWNKATIKEGL